MNIEIQKKPPNEYKRESKIKCPKDVFDLEEIQDIKDAIQEHLIFIGMDLGNNIRSIRLLGVGSTRNINIDSKDILRTALLTDSDKIILVHNHPSNSLKPSNEDIHISNTVNKFLKIIGFELVDHIIVTEENYYSMESGKNINREYVDSEIDIINKTLLIEENSRLKKELENLSSQAEKNVEENDEMEM